MQYLFWESWLGFSCSQVSRLSLVTALQDTSNFEFRDEVTLAFPSWASRIQAKPIVVPTNLCIPLFALFTPCWLQLLRNGISISKKPRDTRGSTASRELQAPELRRRRKISESRFDRPYKMLEAASCYLLSNNLVPPYRAWAQRIHTISSRTKTLLNFLTKPRTLKQLSHTAKCVRHWIVFESAHLLECSRTLPYTRCAFRSLEYIASMRTMLVNPSKISQYHEMSYKPIYGTSTEFRGHKAQQRLIRTWAFGERRLETPMYQTSSTTSSHVNLWNFRCSTN